ncbi:alkaline phosphatase family protein [Oerskovia sp. NPDC056781]|uniref:alkaline phosphatase family protein n=1 Tax=Oerskovia sp. NPDC056781 TaxID=3345942 RepID=UPI00366A5BFA
MTVLPEVLPDGLLAPRYDGLALSSVLPGAAGALGLDLTTATGTSSLRARADLGLPAADRVCVVLVDGLGHANLTERAGHAPFLRSLLGTSRVLTSSFPSTTAAAIGTFGTGTSPGRTGMLGYTQRDTVSGRLANMVSWEGAADPRDLQQEPPVLERLAEAGVEVSSVGPARFAGSGMTVAALRGARYLAAESIADRVDTVAFELTAPGIVYLYWGDVDKAGHHHGWRSRQWGDALSDLDRELGRLARSLPHGTLLIVTADHGMVDVDRSKRWDVAKTPELGRGVDLVGGEPRAVHVYARPDQSSSVAARWSSVLGDDAIVALREDAVAAGWFGPVADHVLPAIGDVVVAMRGRATVVDSRTQTAASLQLVGVHGSLTRTEMQVPLLVTTT